MFVASFGKTQKEYRASGGAAAHNAPEAMPFFVASDAGSHATSSDDEELNSASKLSFDTSDPPMFYRVSPQMSMMVFKSTINTRVGQACHTRTSRSSTASPLVGVVVATL